MPVIGQFNIPDNYFDALANESAISDLEYILHLNPEQISQRFPSLPNYAPHWPISYLTGYLRVVLNDFTSSDQEIENSDPYKAIYDVADLHGKEKVYQLLVNDKALIQSANDFFQRLADTRAEPGQK